jgi:hypothetical protein
LDAESYSSAFSIVFCSYPKKNIYIMLRGRSQREKDTQRSNNFSNSIAACAILRLCGTGLKYAFNFRYKCNIFVMMCLRFNPNGIQ